MAPSLASLSAVSRALTLSAVDLRRFSSFGSSQRKSALSRTSWRERGREGWHSGAKWNVYERETTERSGRMCSQVKHRHFSWIWTNLAGIDVQKMLNYILWHNIIYLSFPTCSSLPQVSKKMTSKAKNWIIYLCRLKIVGFKLAVIT